LFGIVVFFIGYRMRDTDPRVFVNAVLVAGGAAAVMALVRYFAYFSGSRSDVPFEFWFGHDDVLFFGYGLVVAAAAVLRERRNSVRALLLLEAVVLLGAAMATGRRSAILVVAVAALVLLWLMLPKRTALVVALVSAAGMVTVVYLSAFWNDSYGMAAQPARAVRSQLDPNYRDDQSNRYREDEDYNKVETIRLTPVLGLGFGREFFQFRPLPDQTSFWPLQFLTGENNVLWLWLKTGLLGVSALLGIWLIALKRCLVAVRGNPAHAALPLLPLALAAILVLHLTYAQVDQGFSAVRSSAPLAVALAIALGLPLERGPAGRAPSRAASLKGQRDAPADDPLAGPRP
jgi:hypothetical protein